MPVSFEILNNLKLQGALTVSTISSLGNLTISSSNVTISSATPSTSFSTGALVVGGGVGIAGATWINGTVNILNQLFVNSVTNFRSGGADGSVNLQNYYASVIYPNFYRHIITTGHGSNPLHNIWKLDISDGSMSGTVNALTFVGANATLSGNVNINGTLTMTSGTTPQFSIAPTGGRPIRFNASTGFMSFQANPGGWYIGLRFLGSAGTHRGNIWAAGTDDTLDNINIGDASYNHWLRASSTGVTVASTLAVSGTTFTLGQTGGNGAFINMDGLSGNFKIITTKTGGVDRWYFGQDTAAESGSNAGSPFFIRALTDGGTVIDTPLTITRAAGGRITTPRPVTISDSTTSSGISSGALVVTGGVGVGGNVNIDKNLTIGYASVGDSVLKIIRSQGGNEWLQIAGASAGPLGNNQYSIDAVHGANARPVYFRRSSDAGVNYTNFLTWDTSNNAIFSGSVTAGNTISGPTLTPGNNIAGHYFVGYGANTSWPLRLSAIYDANYVDQYITLNGTLTGTRATPTFNGGLTGGSFLRVDGFTTALSIGTFVSGAGAAINIVATFNPTNVNILQSTISNSTSSGALVVNGGVGVGGAINAGGSITSNNASGSGLLGMRSSSGNASYIFWSETTVADRGILGFNAGSSTLSYRSLSSSFATGSEVFSITSGGNVTASGATHLLGTSASAGTSIKVISGVGTLAAPKYSTLDFRTYNDDGSGAYIRTGNRQSDTNQWLLEIATRSNSNVLTHVATFFDSGLLLGATVPANNGRLQLASHTASTGGIGFGTDTSLYRGAAGQLYLDAPSSTSGAFWVNAGVGNASASLNLYPQGTGVAQVSAVGSTSLLLRTNNATALTLDSGQNATFAKDILLGTSGPSVPSTLSGRASRQGLVSDGTALITATSSNIGTGNFTASAWINAASYVASIFGFNGAGGIINCVLDFPSDTLMRVYDGAGPTAYTVTVPTRPVNKWFHATWVRSAGVVTCYLDGVSQGTVTANFDIGAINYIGSISAFNKFTGRLSGLYVYNRALSAAEVKALYENGVPAGEDYNTAGTTLNTANFSDVGGGSTLTGNSSTGVTVVRASGSSYISVRNGGANARPGQRFRLSGTLTLNAGKTVIPVAYVDGTSSTQVSLTAGAFSVEIVTPASGGTVAGIVLAGNGDQNWTLSNFSAISLGTIIAPDANQTGSGLTWYDTSGNGANITLPATGVKWNVPTSGNVTSDSAVNLRAGGTNQDIIARPTGAGRLRVAQSIVAPTYTNNYGITVNDAADTRNVSLGVATNYSFLQSFNSVPLAINPGGNVVLFGKEASSANGFIQLAAHTAISGGIGFGPNMALYLRSANSMRLESTTSGTLFEVHDGSRGYQFITSGGNDLVLASTGNAANGMYLRAHSGQLVLQSNSTTALTLDSSQNATFAKDILLGTSGPSVPGTLSARAPRQGLVFDGTATASASTVGAIGAGDYTVHVVFKAASPTSPLRLVQVGQAGVPQGFQFGTTDSSPAGRLVVRNGDATAQLFGTTVLTANKWYAATAVRSSGTVTIYLNGISDGTGTLATNYSNGTGGMTIHGSTGNYAGTVETAIIYNRALSQDEVRQLYENGAPAAADINSASNTTSLLTAAQSTFTGGGWINWFGSVSISGGQGAFIASASITGVGNYGAAYPSTFLTKPGRRYRLVADVVAISGGNIVIAGSGGNAIATFATTTGTGISLEFTAANSVGGDVVGFGSSAANGTFTLDNVYLYALGAVIAPDAAQTGSGLTWYDTSGNAANITVPASGVSWNVPFNGRTQFADGTNSAPSITFANDPDTGFYKVSAATDIVYFGAGGQPSLRFVGNASLFSGLANSYLQLPVSGAINIVPDAALNASVNMFPSGTGSVIISASSRAGSLETGALRITDSANANRKLFFGIDNTVGTDGVAYIQSTLTGTTTIPLILQPNGGVVLIGTTVNSSAKLQIGTNTGDSAGGIAFGTDQFLYRNTPGQIRLDLAGLGNDAFLSIRGGATHNIGVRFGDSTNDTKGGFIAASNSSATLSLGSGSTTALSFDSTQNASFVGNIQVPADKGLYLKQGNVFRFTSNGLTGGTARADMYADSGGAFFVRTGGATEALTINSSQFATFSKDIQLQGSSGPFVAQTLAMRSSRQGVVTNGTFGVGVSSLFAFGTSDFTLAFIVRRNTNTAQQYLVGNDIGQCLYVGFRVNGDIFSGQAGGTPNADLSLGTPLGRPFHLVLVRSAGVITAYVNALSSATVADTKNYTGAAATLFAADSAGAAALDGFGIVQGFYNRALSATEVRQLYDIGMPAASDYWSGGINVNVGDPTIGLALTNATVTSSTSTSINGINFGANNGQIQIGAGYTSKVGQKVRISFSVTGVTDPNLMYVRWVVNGAEGWTTFAQVGITGSSGTFTFDFPTYYAGPNVIQIRNFATSAQNGVTITNFSARTIGLALAPDANQNGGGTTWYDTSNNGANITIPANGVSWNVPFSGALTPAGAATPVLIKKTQAYLEVNSDDLRRGRFGADGSNSVSLGSLTNSPLDFFVNGAAAARFTTSNLNLLIGGTNDGNAYRLKIFGSNSAVLEGVGVYNTIAYAVNNTAESRFGLGRLEGTTFQDMGAIGARPASDTSSAHGELLFYTRASGTLAVVGRWTNSGNLLIGASGTADSSNGKLQLASHTANTGGIGFGADVTLYRSASNVLRTDDTFQAEATSGTNAAAGILGVLNTSGAGVTNSFGIDARVLVNNSSGTTTSAIGLRSLARVSNTSTVTGLYSIYAQVDNPGSGTITDAYGLYVAPITVGSNNYAIWTEGTTRSRFGGLIDVIGNITSSGSRGFIRYKSANGTTAAPVEDRIVGFSNTNDLLFDVGMYALNSLTDNSSVWLRFKTLNSSGTSTVALTIDSNQNTIVGTAALATNATNGFFYIPTCAGVPTGTPTTHTGRAPMVYDSTNNKFYIYNGSWKSVTLA